MNYKGHETMGYLLLIFSDIYLIQQHLTWETIAKWSAFVYLFTVLITPDWDTKSIPGKRASVFGWIANKCFRHRGMLHSYTFWAAVFIPVYYFTGWVCLGGLAAVYLHIIVDSLSTGFKRAWPF